jgi:hypothetical protein
LERKRNGKANKKEYISDTKSMHGHVKNPLGKACRRQRVIEMISKERKKRGTWLLFLVSETQSVHANTARSKAISYKIGDKVMLSTLNR